MATKYTLEQLVLKCPNCGVYPKVRSYGKYAVIKCVCLRVGYPFINEYHNVESDLRYIAQKYNEAVLRNYFAKNCTAGDAAGDACVTRGGA